MIRSATLRGIEARVVKIVAARDVGLPTLQIRGLAAAAERETRVRVHAALTNSRRDLDGRIDVSCDASGGAIDGTGLDLPIALAIAGCNSVDLGAVGELSLAGDVRPVRGILAAVEELKKQRVGVVLVAPDNAAEAALVDGVRIVVVRRLVDALRFLAGDSAHTEMANPTQPPLVRTSLDMRDIKGQLLARRALEIAAAGHHNLLLCGGPGAGKTMLARRLTGIMPPMTAAEALDVTRVHSAAGLNVGGGLITSRPFRAPHHSTTPPGVVGGGASTPRPGEVTLAHNGVLFLDELPEFSRGTLEVLREPLTTSEVVLSRATGTIRYPSHCLLVGAMSPCPCGCFGLPRCRCADADRARYRGRVPAPLLDCFDVRVEIPPVDLSTLERDPAGEASVTIAARIARAQTRLARCAPTLHRSDTATRRLVAQSAPDCSPNTLARVARVAATIAQLAGSEIVHAPHVDEALALAGAAATP